MKNNFIYMTLKWFQIQILNILVFLVLCKSIILFINKNKSICKLKTVLMSSYINLVFSYNNLYKVNDTSKSIRIINNENSRQYNLSKLFLQ